MPSRTGYFKRPGGRVAAPAKLYDYLAEVVTDDSCRMLISFRAGKLRPRALVSAAAAAHPLRVVTVRSVECFGLSAYVRTGWGAPSLDSCDLVVTGR